MAFPIDFAGRPYNTLTLYRLRCDTGIREQYRVVEFCIALTSVTKSCDNMIIVSAYRYITITNLPISG